MFLSVNTDKHGASSYRRMIMLWWHKMCKTVSCQDASNVKKMKMLVFIQVLFLFIFRL